MYLKPLYCKVLQLFLYNSYFTAYCIKCIYINYLAHAYLSFNDQPVLVGNMISDFVKGKTKFEYPVTIQKGIALHRAIDMFTDDHPATKAAKEYFRPVYRLYAGAFTDVVYDHFLANDKNEFASEEVLNAFAASVYDVLSQHQEYLPPHFARMFPYMQAQNWLYYYRTGQGTEKSFGGLQRRSLYITQVESAAEIFYKHYNALHKCYDEFFPSVKKFAMEVYQSS